MLPSGRRDVGDTSSEKHTKWVSPDRLWTLRVLETGQKEPPSFSRAGAVPGGLRVQVALLFKYNYV